MAALDRYTKKSAVREVVVILVAVIMTLPFYLLVVMSLKTGVEAATSSPVAPPTQPTLDNFRDVLGGVGSRDVVGSLINSAIITTGSVISLIVIGSMAAYAISRRSGRASTAVYLIFVIGIILPFQLGMIPTYVVMRSVGLLGSHLGMIVLYTGILMPLAVFLYTGFARALPRDYEEAASIDGASKFQVFRKVVFPLLGPATGTVAILTGLIVWNDFFTGLIFTSGSKAVTLPVVVYSFVGENVTNWTHIFAIVMISMLPVLIAYMFAQKKFIQGFAGGVKG